MRKVVNCNALEMRKVSTPSEIREERISKRALALTLRTLRDKYGLTQSQAASEAELRNYTKIENEYTLPSVHYIRKIIKGMNGFTKPHTITFMELGQILDESLQRAERQIRKLDRE